MDIPFTLTGIRQQDRGTEGGATLAHNGMRNGSPDPSLPTPIPDWDQEEAMDMGS